MMESTCSDSGNETKIKVIGVGGAGIHAVNCIIKRGVKNVEFITVDRDPQALDLSMAPVRIQIGNNFTDAHATPEDCNKEAEEYREIIQKSLLDADMVFIVAGMGGNTGTGVSQMVGALCKEIGILTVAVVTKPFKSEGRSCHRNAETGIERLKQCADTVITVSNEHILSITNKAEYNSNPFYISDDMLYRCIRSVYDLIAIPDFLNADFEDIKCIFANAGYALIGNGSATGIDSMINAAKAAISSPFLEDSIGKGLGIIIDFTGGKDLSMTALNDALATIQEEASPDAFILFGSSIDNELANDESQVTIIVTQFKDPWDPDGKCHDLIKRDDDTDIYTGWVRRPEVDYEQNSTGDLVPRSDGKKICDTLKEMRLELARANNIPFESEKCTFAGPCAGTCPQCDKEASYLREKLSEINPENRKYPPFLNKVG